MSPGDRVFHPIFGHGTIQRVQGRMTEVQFDDHAPTFRMTQADLVPVEAPELALPPMHPDDAVQALEALRLGVVPATAAAAMTVRRDNQIDAIHGLLGCGSGLRVVRGPYGSGKTHMLEVGSAEALAANWLVATATFDPQDISPSHPIRIYGALIRGLRYPSGEVGSGLLPLLEKIPADADHLVGTRSHRWLSAALFAVHNAPDLVYRVLDLIEGQAPLEAHTQVYQALRQRGYRGPKLYMLRDVRTIGQIVAYLLGGIASWAKEAGYQGLFLVLDEAEFVDRLGSADRLLAKHMLSFLAMATLPEDKLAFDPEDLHRGGHEVHRRIPVRFTDDQPLAAITAFTPNPAIDEVLSQILKDDSPIELDVLGHSAAEELADRVLALVRIAHPHVDPPSTDRRVIRQIVGHLARRHELESTRDIAKVIVTLWDLYRLRGPEVALHAARS